MNRVRESDSDHQIRKEKWLLAIQTLAGLAQWIDIFLIFTVPSFLWKSSPAEIAFLASCLALPSLFFGPFLGALLDRVNPRKMMMLGALLRTGLTVMIAFAPGFQFFSALVFLKGLANLLYWPAAAIVTNQVVPEARRVKYFSSLSALDQLAKIGTPLVAGFIALIVKPQWAFLVSAMLTLVCATILPVVGSKTVFSQTMHRRTISGLLQDLFFGLRAIKSLPEHLLASIALGIGMSLALAIYDPHLAAFIDSKGFNAGVFSVVVSATGAGAVAGALLVHFVLNEASPVSLMRIGIIAFAFAVSGAAIIVNFTPGLLGPLTLFLLWFLNGLGYEMFVIGSSVNTQNLCPPTLLGRISTSVRSLQMSAVVLGPSAGAWLIATYSRTAPFIAAALVAWVLCGSAMVLFGSRKREMPIV